MKYILLHIYIVMVLVFCFLFEPELFIRMMDHDMIFMPNVLLLGFQLLSIPAKLEKKPDKREEIIGQTINLQKRWMASDKKKPRNSEQRLKTAA